MNTFLGKHNPVPTIMEVEAKLLELCRLLNILMAANWILIENGQTKLASGFEKLDAATLIDLIAKRLNCDPSAAEVLLNKKIALIEPVLGTLETAHTSISGKYLLHQVYVFAKTQRGWTKDYLLRLLIRRVKEIGDIHPDIRFIVEKRILGDP